MRVVFLASREPDYLAAVTWRGLNEVLGIGNVLDAHAVNGCCCYYLHEYMLRPSNESGNPACEAIGQLPGTWINNRWASDLDRPIGAALVVLHYSSWKDTQSWVTAEAVLRCMKPGYKLAYVCGDDHTGPYPDPPVPATVRFQREIEPGQTSAVKLCFAAPQNWACTSRERPIDAIFAGAVNNECRRTVVAKMCLLAKDGFNVCLAGGERLLSWDVYMQLLKKSKVAICPPGAGADTMRLYEAMASGAEPLEVCPTSGELLARLESVDPARVVNNFMRRHTTCVRAAELLRACGF